VTGQQPEIALRYDQVQKTGHATDRAIAVLNLDRVGCFDFKLHRAAMAAALVDHKKSPYLN